MNRSLNYQSAAAGKNENSIMGSGFRVQGSGLGGQSPRGYPVNSGQCETASGCVHPSSFILRPSSLILKASGYTLVEILVAVVLTLILMGAVVQMFGTLGRSITDSRSFLEASERLNSAAARLQMDLKGVTVKMLPPRNPDDGEGYFEYIEGPAPPQQYVQYDNKGNIVQHDWDTNLLGIGPRPVNTDNNQTDTTVGDCDDILMFTTRSTDKPFVGLADSTFFGTTAVKSDVAEVAWFMRGRMLYRRQLLVAPGLWNNLSAPITNGQRFYEKNDISIRVQNGVIVPNTLSDLTRRECRYAHPTGVFPFDARRWGLLGLPTLQESATWDLLNPPIPPNNTSPPNPSPLNTYYPSQYCYFSVFTPPFNSPLDLWTNDSSHRLPDPCPLLIQGVQSNRIADDVILTNVIGFDVKAWEPALGQYVDLGYEMRPVDLSNPTKIQEIKHSDDSPYIQGEMFYHRGYCPSNAPANGYYAYILGCYFVNSTTPPLFAPRVYDTWSTHYESVGLAGLSQTTYPPGRSTNGFDDPGNNGTANGIVDDEDEKITSPPYPAPLRGIQVKIRVFEPDSRQIREVTIIQDFLPK